MQHKLSSAFRRLGYSLTIFTLNTAGNLTFALADETQIGAESRFAKSVDVLHPFCKAQKWGYINRQGKVIIEAQFDYAGRFSEGFAAARKGDVAGYLRANGTWAFELPKQLSPTRTFRDGRVAFQDDGKFGFLDREGKVVVPAIYDHVTDFREGRSGVLVGYGRPVGGDEPPGGQWGFIDRDGKLVIPTKFAFGPEFSEGLAPTCACVRLLIRGPTVSGEARGVAPNWERIVDKPGWDFIDRDGKPALTVSPDPGHPAAFISSVGYFSEGLLKVHAYMSDDPDVRSRAGFVDKAGKTIIPFRFESAMSFSEGRAAVAVSDKWGYIDRQGGWLICPQFDEADDFCEGLARVRLDKQWLFADRKGCLIASRNCDLNGKHIAASPWNDSESFNGGLAVVHVGGELDCTSRANASNGGHNYW